MNLFFSFHLLEKIVGKPGSSKSLAKTVIGDTMRGKNSTSEFFKKFKHIQVFSYQCSPLSTSAGIIDTFKSAKQFQKNKKDPSFVSVVVLDEIGLAEDSPQMPLKVLHSLLEEKQVAFVGISNWALDPAKMNRGVSGLCCVEE